MEEKYSDPGIFFGVGSGEGRDDRGEIKRGWRKKKRKKNTQTTTKRESKECSNKLFSVE